MRVVATAGHVDHGKSALVLAPTGTDPDRFPEEKARGLTIDLGFAFTTLSTGGLADEVVGFVDVTITRPGPDVDTHRPDVRGWVQAIAVAEPNSQVEGDLLLAYAGLALALENLGDFDGVAAAFAHGEGSAELA